jgi:hypothetical protein
MPTEKSLASPTDLSEYLGVPPRTLQQWRWRKTGPRWTKVGRRVRYRWDDVDRWLNENAAEAEVPA